MVTSQTQHCTNEGVLRSNSACSMLISEDLRLPRRGIESRPSGIRDIDSTSRPSPLHKVRYDTIRYDTIRYDSIRCEANQAMRCDAMRCDTIRYDTIRYDTIRYETIRYDDGYDTMPYDTRRYKMIRYDTIRYDTTRLQCNNIAPSPSATATIISNIFGRFLFATSWVSTRTCTGLHGCVTERLTVPNWT